MAYIAEFRASPGLFSSGKLGAEQTARSVFLAAAALVCANHVYALRAPECKRLLHAAETGKQNVL